jgi:hypothetical protein
VALVLEAHDEVGLERLATGVFRPDLNRRISDAAGQLAAETASSQSRPVCGSEGSSFSLGLDEDQPNHQLYRLGHRVVVVLKEGESAHRAWQWVD